MSWVMKSTVLCECSQILSRSSCMSEPVWLSSAPNGSSMSRMSGSLASARASATRCIMPRELLGVGALEAFEADFRDEAARDCGALVGGHAADLKAELEVVLHGEPGKQGVGLEHHAAVLARLGDQLAVQIDGARRRLNQAGDQP